MKAEILEQSLCCGTEKHDTIVNNESREIIRMFDTFYEAGLGNGTTLSPVSLRKEIDAGSTQIMSL